jgi:outer membrane autotransporter protein
MSLLSFKKIVILLTICSFLHADNIIVTNVDFADKIANAANGDVVVFDDGYDLQVLAFTNINSVFLNGNKTVLIGDAENRIFETAAGGSFGGFSDITLQNGGMNGNGGALHVWGNLTKGVYDSRFLDNKADIGGGIYVYGNFLGNVSNSEFANNNAYNYGGAISVANEFSGKISNSTFIGNRAEGGLFGGGAILSAVFSGDIEDSLFADNLGHNGGAIYSENFYGTITDTNFTNNRANGNGGAIYIHGELNATLRSTGYMLFAGNTDSDGYNAIYYYGNGGHNNGVLNIITDDGAVMEFKDGIADYGTNEGKLAVNKNGGGVLIYNADMRYRGDTNINGGTLVLNNDANIVGDLYIGNSATLAVNKTSSYEFAPNAYIDRGVLDINLNSRYNRFSFADQNLQQNFNGTLNLTKAYYELSRNSNYTLSLNKDSIASLNQADASIKELIFNEGELNIEAAAYDMYGKPILTIDNLTIKNGGSINFYTDFSDIIIDMTADENLYDSLNKTYEPLYQVINATVYGDITAINVKNISPYDYIMGNIIQNGNVTGEAYISVIGKMESDGLYAGFGNITGIKSLTNVIFDSKNTLNNVLNIALSGIGDFTFTGNNSVFIGNSYSSYEGSTYLKDNANITAISDNAFGRTNALSLESNTAFDLNSHSQTVYGNLDNNGNIYLNNGYLGILGSTSGNGTIDLGSYGYLSLNEGALIGDNLLKGGGTIYFSGNFDINGTNENLYADTVVYGGTVSLNNTRALGEKGYIYLSSYNSAVKIDTAYDETINKSIYGYGSLIKDGDGLLKLDGYTSVRLAEIISGSLIVDMSNFYGDINIWENTNLILNNSGDSTYYGRISGSGNITQFGDRTFIINSDNSGFSGAYTVQGGSLVIGSSGDYAHSSLGGDVTVNNALLQTFGNIKGNLVLNNSSWQLNSNSHIKTLNLVNTSSVYLSNQLNDFGTTPPLVLSIDNLSGEGGSFYQRVDVRYEDKIAINNGDLIVINNSSSGNHIVHFADKSTGNMAFIPLDENIIAIRQDNQNGNYNADFTGTVDVGAYTYVLTKSDTNNSFYLKSTSCAIAACMSISFPNINYLLNHIADGTFFRKMNELDADRHNKDDIWTKVYVGELDSFKDEFKIDKTNYYGFSMGADRAYEAEQGSIFFGITAGFIKADVAYEVGSASIDNYNAGLYGVFKGDDGFYIDLLAKYQINKNRFNTKTSNGFDVDGKGDNNGITVAIEGGKRYDIEKFYVEPQVRFSYLYQNGMTIRSSNGLKTDIDDLESMRVGISTVLGYALKEKTDLYLKAGYINEFKGSHKYSFNNNDEQTYIIDWKFFDSAIGIASNIGNNYFYIEGVYQVGDAFNNKKLNLEYRYEF